MAVEQICEPHCWADALDEDALQANFANWLAKNKVGSFEQRDKIVLDEYHGAITPRSIFLKNLRADAAVLDLGAGNGMLTAFKSWPGIKRPDIKMYAVSLGIGEHFHLYQDYEINDFEKSFPQFDGMAFDAVMCAHFIEHLRDPDRCIRWIASRLAPGGRVYLEWPHVVSKKLPKSSFFSANGLNVMTSNFYDDGTHIEAWNMNDIVNMCHRSGLALETFGRIHFDRVATLFNQLAHATGDSVYGTFSVWLRVGWPQYLVAYKR
jgi:2-polyprenyl-3-methyl-5-hydroxy-6-metoxy-1,4-benzoquinol methylase